MTTLGEIASRIDVPAVAECVLARLRRERPDYERNSPEMLERLRATVTLHISLAITALVGGRAVPDEEMSPLWLSAQGRFDAGVSVEGVLAAYGLGTREVWGALVDATEPGEEAQLLLAVDFIIAHLARLAAGVTHTYLEERAQAASEHERRLQRLLTALCRPSTVSADAQEFARFLRFPMRDDYEPMAIVLPHSDHRAHAALAADLQALAVLAMSEGVRVVAVAAPGAIIPLLDDDHLVVRGPSTGRVDLAQILDDLRLVVDLAARVGRRGEWPLGRLGPELLVARQPDVARELRQAVLAPLEAAGGRANAADLCATVEAYFAAGLDRSAAASILVVHPNTVDRRLRRIEELTGLDLADVADLSRLQLALLARSSADIERH